MEWLGTGNVSISNHTLTFHTPGSGTLRASPFSPGAERSGTPRSAAPGSLPFSSKSATRSPPLSSLSTQSPRATFDPGGLDMQPSVERYPSQVAETRPTIMLDLRTPTTLTPYFVNVTQVDGQMAWSSPTYLKR